MMVSGMFWNVFEVIPSNFITAEQLSSKVFGVFAFPMLSSTGL